MCTVHEELRFLLASDNRTAALSAMASDGPLDRAALEAHLDVASRTVVRTVEALTEHGYLEDRGDRLAVTAYGRYVADIYESLDRDVRIATAYRPFLRHLRGGVLDFNVSRLRGAKLVVASEASPFALIDRTLQLRRSVTGFRELAPGVERKSIEQLADRLSSNESLDVGVILTADAVRAATGHPDYAEAHEAIRQHDDTDLYVHDGSVPLFIGVFGDTVTLTVSVDGQPYAMIETDDTEIREWARRRLDDYRDDSVPLDKWEGAASNRK